MPPTEASEERKPVPPPRMSVATSQVGELITVEIGPEHRKYILHKSFLCHYSEYFKKALNGKWKEAKEKTIYIDDVEPIVFNIFVDWMYTQQLPKNWDWVKELDEELLIDGNYNPKFRLLIQALIFGDRFLVSDFRIAVYNATVDYILDFAVATFEAVIYAFENLPSDSGILRLLVDAHCQYWVDEVGGPDEEMFSELPVEFVKQVMKKYSKQLVEDRGWFDRTLTNCSYHEHASDGERKKCQKQETHAAG